MEFALTRIQRFRARFYTLLLRPFFFRFGKDSVIMPPLRFHNLKGIECGSNVLIHGNAWLQTIYDRHPGVPLLSIKDHTTIGMNATITAAKKIVIEEYVLFGRNVHISDHGHEFHDVKRPIMSQGIRKQTEVVIGAESWIGQNAVILPGARIGRHCVIGANAVVTSVLPDFTVAAGAPARAIQCFNPSLAKWESLAR